MPGAMGWGAGAGAMGYGMYPMYGGYGMCPGMGMPEGGTSGPTAGTNGAMGSKPPNQQMMPGDWTCPKCSDLVFARNNACRRCATPKPEGAGDTSGANASGGLRGGE